MSGPRDTYERRLAERRAELAAADRRDAAIAHLRLVVFVAGTALAIAAARGVVDWGWVWLPAAGFLALVVVHGRLLAGRACVEAGCRHYERGLARVDGRFAGTGVTRTDFADAAHPYAADLDLFGRGSLFELLCTARTRAGEATLAAWLLAPAGAEEVRARQAAVAELRPRVDLREDLEVLAGGVRAAVDPERLAAWGAAPADLPGRGARLAALLLSAFALAALLAWAFLDAPLAPFLAAVGAELAVTHAWRDRVGRVTSTIDRAAAELAVLARVVERFQREPAESPRLAELRSRLAPASAAARIRQLARLVQWLDARRNQLFAPIALVLMWPVHFALAIEAWRQRWGRAVGGWLAAVGELEALAALAAYAYEHPRDPFPEVVEAGPLLDGEGLAHPLIDVRRAVPNDVRLGGRLRVLMVSGSNMSGKSTLLRTVGTNVVLALAGAPVRARALRLSPLAVGATLRVQDSLETGVSRFYAEITRLRQLVDLASGPTPLLFLLDEILGGTNSADRTVGAESVIRGLVEKGAIGLVTTHDLALADAIASLGDAAANVHFEDRLEAGRLHFDYRLRPGVVTRSNALELMRAVGLDVGAGAPQGG
ncbi:MAG TPA: DNA mismatch repair protein MutS [Thermodesulfobacteriota bacterium]